MYNVLTIDLDYIAEPYIQLYWDTAIGFSVEQRWDKVFSDPAFSSNNFDINPDNVIYALDIFGRSLVKCKNVVFGIQHDSILFDLEDKDNLNIVNIDHHHDIVYVPSQEESLKYDIVDEGDWVEYLHRKSKVKKYVWIRNENSMLRSPSLLEYSSYLKDDYQFEMEPDLIYVCLSPAFIPKFHWFYFKIFMNLYKAFYDDEPRFYEKPYKNNPCNNSMRGYEDFLQEVTT